MIKLSQSIFITVSENIKHVGWEGKKHFIPMHFLKKGKKSVFPL